MIEIKWKNNFRSVNGEVRKKKIVDVNNFWNEVYLAEMSLDGADNTQG